MATSPASGDQGFEGFVRDCFEEHLGIRFRLMKSGPQGGADIITDLPANQLTIAVEAKRYGAKTHLPVDALRFKIGEVVKSFPGLDLWVLATTKSMTKTDTATLHNTGADDGIAVAVLDAGSTANAASNLTLLAAGAPHAVEAHLTLTMALLVYLARVKAHATYDARLQLILEPFKRLDVGYAGARVAARRWLETAFADRASAKARLHCHGDLAAAGSMLVSRPAISAALDQWWGTGPAKPLALTGAEGTGKTWSLLAWWRDQMRDHPERLPLTLFVPARATGLSDLTGPQLIARLLHERTPERSLDFWTRRLALWLAQEDPHIVAADRRQQHGYVIWLRRHLAFAHHLAGIVHYAHGRLLHRDIQTHEMRHRSHSFPRCTRSGSTPIHASYVKGLQSHHPTGEMQPPRYAVLRLAISAAIVASG